MCKMPKGNNPIHNYVSALTSEHVHSQREREAIMKDCKLKYRNGKSDADIFDILKKKRQPCIVNGLFPWVEVVWHGKPKSFSDLFEEMAEEIDKVVMIDWESLYGKAIPSLTFI